MGHLNFTQKLFLNLFFGNKRHKDFIIHQKNNKIKANFSIIIKQKSSLLYFVNLKDF